MKQLAWISLLALGFAACGDTGTTPRQPIQDDVPRDPKPQEPKKPRKPKNPEPEPKFPDPWPKDAVRHFGPPQGLPGPIIGVGVDDAKNVYVIDGMSAYALPAGEERFVRTATGGQFETGYPVTSIAGGAPEQVYLGFLAPEGKTVFDWTEEEKMMGDVDRMILMPDGTLELDHHYKIQNTNAKWMDETRSILTMKRVVGGDYHGDVYLGSNHGATVLRGDEWADHRHPIFLDENESMVIGYVHGVDYDPQGNFFIGAHWMLAVVPPAPLDDLERWVSIVDLPWLAYTWPEHLGPIEEPKDIRAIAGDMSQSKIFVGMFGLGLSEVVLSPRAWRSIPGTPDTHILGLEWEHGTDTLWVATASRGLWRWDIATETWEQSPFVPANAQVSQVLVDETVEPRAVYAATNHGLYVIRAP